MPARAIRRGEVLNLPAATLALIGVALMLLNVATFCIWGMDKRRAQRGERRIRESDLLTLAAIGGTGGAYLGRRIFRHKSRKTSFSIRLHLVAAIQATALLGWLLLHE